MQENILGKTCGKSGDKKMGLNYNKNLIAEG